MSKALRSPRTAGWLVLIFGGIGMLYVSAGAALFALAGDALSLLLVSRLWPDLGMASVLLMRLVEVRWAVRLAEHRSEVRC